MCIRDRADVKDFLKPCFLNELSHPELKQLFTTLKEERGIEYIYASINNIVLENKGLFHEDLYQFLLQDSRINKIESLTLIVKSINHHLHSVIDHLNLIDPLLLRIMIAIQERNFPITEEMTKSLMKLLESINERFNIKNCLYSFHPITRQYLLDFFLQAEKLTESKTLISSIVADKRIPEDQSVLQYFQLLDKFFKNDKSNSFFLNKLLCLSDILPILRSSKNPLMFKYIIQVCRTFNEVESLIRIMRECEGNCKELILSTMDSFIVQTNSFSVDEMTNSANLSTLYGLTKELCRDEVPNELIIKFLLAFALNQNYFMMSLLIARSNLTLTSQVINQIQENIGKRRVIHGNVGYDERSKEIFMQKILLINK